MVLRNHILTFLGSNTGYKSGFFCAKNIFAQRKQWSIHASHLAAVQQQQATDILTIDNRIWFRVLGSLNLQTTLLRPLKNSSGFELNLPLTFAVFRLILHSQVYNTPVKYLP